MAAAYTVFSYGGRLPISCACRLRSWQIDSSAQNGSLKVNLKTTGCPFLMSEWRTKHSCRWGAVYFLEFWFCVFCVSFSFCKPHLTLSSLYPSEFLVQKITEDNQIPLHLHVSVSLQYVAGLKGNALVEFFHGNIAEVVCLAQVDKKMPGGLSVLDGVFKMISLFRLKSWALRNHFVFPGIALGILPGVLCLQIQLNTLGYVLKMW